MRQTSFPKCRGRMTLRGLGAAQAWQQENVGIREIGRRLKHSHSNVLKHLNRTEGDGLHKPRVPPRIPSKAMTEIRKRRQEIKRIANERGEGHHKKKFPSSYKIARECTRRGICVSPTTVRADLKVLGYVCKRRPQAQKLYPGDPQDRVHFAKHVDASADNLFSDEKLFDSNDHSLATEWVPHGCSPQVREKERWAPKVHVWGMIGVGVKELVVLKEGAVTADEYKRQVLQKVVVPVVERLRAEGRDPVFMQDNAPCHKAHRTLNYLASKLIKMLQNWPPRSPDLNPIENLWAMIQRLVSERGPRDKEELTRFVVEVWERIPQTVIDEYVLSFEHRVKQVIAAKGHHLPR